jgi:hypothetical protein
MERIKPTEIESDELPMPWEMDRVITQTAWSRQTDGRRSPRLQVSGLGVHVHWSATKYRWRIGELKGGERDQVEK